MTHESNDDEDPQPTITIFYEIGVVGWGVRDPQPTITIFYEIGVVGWGVRDDFLRNLGARVGDLGKKVFPNCFVGGSLLLIK